MIGCELLIGLLIITIVLFDVFQSVVVPRWTPRTLRLAPLLVKTLWPLWRQSGLILRSPKRREYFLGIFAPLGLILELLIWIVSLICGYGLMLYALRSFIRPVPKDLGTTLYLAGSSLFTLGSSDLVTIGAVRVIVLAAAATGLAVMSLVIALLFSLYNSLQRREVLVVLLDTRAGTPPSGVTLLETYARLNMLNELPLAFANWEVWSAEVFESHRAYPLLPFFRSTLENNSWISVIGSVLDACTLLLSTVDSKDYGAAFLMYRNGCRLILELNRLFHLPITDEVGVKRDQFEQARASLARAGFVLCKPEKAWRSFVQMRSVYGGALNALARYFATPLTQWDNYLSTLSYTSPYESEDSR